MTRTVDFSTLSSTLSLSVNVTELSPEQQRDITFALLRATGVAYVPDLKDAIEDISNALNFRANPTKVPVPVFKTAPAKPSIQPLGPPLTDGGPGDNRVER